MKEQLRQEGLNDRRRPMTDEEIKRFQKYVWSLQLANGIVNVLKREEREDMAELLRKCHDQSWHMDDAITRQ
jgi:hypothetical protein